MEPGYILVDFEKWCPKCEFKECLDWKDPCNECLVVGARQGTDKPESFKEK